MLFFCIPIRYVKLTPFRNAFSRCQTIPTRLDSFYVLEGTWYIMEITMDAYKITKR